jgi:hypothetical protein
MRCVTIYLGEASAELLHVYRNCVCVLKQIEATGGYVFMDTCLGRADVSGTNNDVIY